MTLTGAVNGAAVREMEHASIREFVASCVDEYRDACVLDFGCGKQPYRDLIEAAGGDYHGFDSTEFGGNVSGEDVYAGDDEWPVGSYDTVLCTQVIQYVVEPKGFVESLGVELRSGGALVLTYPLNWDWIEPADSWRFTPTGMKALLTDAGFEVERNEERAAIEFPGFRLPLGYGVVARAT